MGRFPLPDDRVFGGALPLAGRRPAEQLFLGTDRKYARCNLDHRIAAVRAKLHRAVVVREQGVQDGVHQVLFDAWVANEDQGLDPPVARAGPHRPRQTVLGASCGPLGGSLSTEGGIVSVREKRLQIHHSRELR